MLMRYLIWHHTSLLACGGMLACAELWQFIMLVHLLDQATHVIWWLAQPIVPHHHQPLKVPQMESRVQLEALKCNHGRKVPLLKLAAILKEVLQHQILLCQLLHFCLIFRRKQAPRLIGSAQKNPTDSLQKGQTVQTGQMVLGTKGVEKGTQGKPMRLGSDNGSQGYTSEEVKVLFIILVDLCRMTAGLPHTLPNSQVMPRPRGADAAGTLLSELELQPPSQEWHGQNIFGGPWSDPEDLGPDPSSPILGDDHICLESPGLWRRKRRLSEREAAFILNASVRLGFLSWYYRVSKGRRYRSVKN